jgi:predicted ATPase/DNA-binding CsgD family transcriptional regulator
MTRLEDGVPERLARAGVTAREAEVLWAVAERRRNREIAERLHLSVRTVESHIAALLRKLAVPDRAALAETGAQLRRTAHADAALPAPLTSLVGRENETNDLGELLAAHRLVTLIGPAGVGKTRLALRVATLEAHRFPDGVRFVDLAPVRQELVGDAVARALGVVPEPGWSPHEILREVAAGMAGLLLVDNCEHVVAAAAEIIADLLGTDGPLRVLATSREPLGVPGEVSYPVQPMPVPALDAAVRADGIADFDAVRLFVDRAATASPGFTLTDADAPAVAALCQRLDGLPLAIELAASRVRTFGPVELVAHLDHRFELLSAGGRTVGPRHRTLRSAIDWSYELLGDDERAVFDRLGVFPADFDYDAVQSVAQDSQRGTAVIELLPRLVDKSLVSTVGRETRRYRLLETVRAYAAERLAATGAEPTIRRRHAGHYIEVAEHAAQQLETSDQRNGLDRLAAEQPNLRAALANSIAARDIEPAWRLIAALHRFWDITGQRREAHDWIKQTLAIGDPPGTPAVVAGLAAASGILHARDAGAAFSLASQAMQLASGLDDLTRARAARAVGISAIWVQPELGRPALQDALAWFGADHPWERALTMQGLTSTSTVLSEALQWGRDSVALFRSVGDQIYAANTLFMMAQRSMYAGIGDAEVRGWLSESRELAEAAGSEADIIHATVGFAQLAWVRGDQHEAAGLMQECLPTLRRLGDRRCAGRALFVLGERARVDGDLARAEELLRASVEAVAVAGQSAVLVWGLEALAAVLSARNEPRTAAELLGVAHHVREVASAHVQPIRPPDEELHRDVAHALGPADFAAAHGEGEQLTPIQWLTRAGRR